PIDEACIASPEDIRAWDGVSRCCSPECFRIDLNATAATPWNKSVAKVFVKDFIAAEVYQCRSEIKIERAFIAHLRTLKRRYERQRQTDAEIRRTTHNHAKDQRRHTLFQQRLKIAVNTAQLRKHVNVLRDLGPDGMSSDEPDPVDMGLGVRQYRISIMPWRSPALNSWLRVFDTTYRFSKFYLQEDDRGALPRVRTAILPNSARPQDYSSRRPVPGLPGNTYNPEWLRRLHPVELEDLHRRAEYSFIHDDELFK
ncbi:uncharacterized protein LAESUDRAFT_662478, partial [Laetiporus sulphureus 93-53]